MVEESFEEMNEDIKFAIKAANYEKFVNLVESATKLTQKDVDRLLDEICTVHLKGETRGFGGKMRQQNIKETVEAQPEIKVGRKQFIKPGPTFLMARYLINEYDANPKSMKNGTFQSKAKIDLLKRLKVIDD